MTATLHKRKTLKELTLKDDFMFGAVMADENNCRRLLEMVLQVPIERVEVCKEKSIIYHPERKGIRLDVYAKDEKNTHYNVEMQSVRKPALEKRARYYHSQIDMELLFSGEEYANLPNAYVIFICDFDPYGEGLYYYTFEQQCKELVNLKMNDGSKTIFLSTLGRNPEEVPETMVNFLKYVKADLRESENDFDDEYVASIQESVQRIKDSKSMEENYMVWCQLLNDERAEARAEGRAEGRAETAVELIEEFLEELGGIPEELREKINSEKNLGTLKRWHKLAARSESVEQFEQNM